ncbi:unnamed protein product [Vitrella brassicaformis CCMP3155]|uniref:F-box domain-containing protein n=2 Tax=Vitrella brassicaformis TaxID=1169539 RepID=A0A0G4GVR8_VITBC|nr:unnamed protein product [Vitrella brassicaformis CCMP3155]|eukprot:CEM34949.1 unnamed protein product [Vitrella brassicaformis CCMP3155]
MTTSLPSLPLEILLNIQAFVPTIDFIRAFSRLNRALRDVIGGDDGLRYLRVCGEEAWQRFTVSMAVRKGLFSRWGSHIEKTSIAASKSGIDGAATRVDGLVELIERASDTLRVLFVEGHSVHRDQAKALPKRSATTFSRLRHVRILFSDWVHLADVRNWRLPVLRRFEAHAFPSAHLLHGRHADSMKAWVCPSSCLEEISVSPSVCLEKAVEGLEDISHLRVLGHFGRSLSSFSLIPSLLTRPPRPPSLQHIYFDYLDYFAPSHTADSRPQQQPPIPKGSTGTLARIEPASHLLTLFRHLSAPGAQWHTKLLSCRFLSLPTHPSLTSIEDHVCAVRLVERVCAGAVGVEVHHRMGQGEEGHLGPLRFASCEEMTVGLDCRIPMAFRHRQTTYPKLTTLRVGLRGSPSDPQPLRHLPHLADTFHLMPAVRSIRFTAVEAIHTRPPQEEGHRCPIAQLLTALPPSVTRLGLLECSGDPLGVHLLAQFLAGRTCVGETRQPGELPAVETIRMVEGDGSGVGRDCWTDAMATTAIDRMLGWSQLELRVDAEDIVDFVRVYRGLIELSRRLTGVRHVAVSIECSDDVVEGDETYTAWVVISRRAAELSIDPSWSSRTFLRPVLMPLVD